MVMDSGLGAGRPAHQNAVELIVAVYQVAGVGLLGNVAACGGNVLLELGQAGKPPTRQVRRGEEEDVSVRITEGA